MKYNTARAGKIRDAAGRREKCGREKPPAAKPSVNELPVHERTRGKLWRAQ